MKMLSVIRQLLARNGLVVALALLCFFLAWRTETFFTTANIINRLLKKR